MKVLLGAVCAAIICALPAQASVGVNVSPGWGDTVDGRDMAGMEARLLNLRADTARMPWVDVSSDGGRTREALRFDAANGIDSLVIDNGAADVEAMVAQIAAAGQPVTAIEGVNEPDVPATGYTTTEVPITAEKLAEVRARQERLYAAVAGRWPVLCPSAVYRVNEPALNALPCDVLSAHRYGARPGPPTASDATLPTSSKPIWVTETGYPTYMARPLNPYWVVSDAQQRDYLVWMRDTLRANGAARVVVYKLSDDGQRPLRLFEPSQNWGLFTKDGTAKPAVAALRGG